MLEQKNILITGGAGTLGHAIAQMRKEQGWTGRLTVYSTDTHKHDLMRRDFPDIRYVQGDIRNPETLYNAMVGHDVVIHAAAVKVIPASEWYSIDTFDVNVQGSWNVCAQAIRADVRHVLGISTDKACHPANAYGASKLLMEKIFQEYARISSDTSFHLVRYGNVLESTGSVIETWKHLVDEGIPISITDPQMTRFWLSPKQAAELVVKSMRTTSGTVLIPKMKALSVLKLAECVLEGDIKYSLIPMRPGEKMHEELLTVEEVKYAVESEEFYFLRPTTQAINTDESPKPFASDSAPELTISELEELLNG